MQHADVYAFGVLLVEMFLGERSFTGMRQPQIIHTIAVLKKHPELPTRAPAFLQVSPYSQDYAQPDPSVARKRLNKANIYLDEPLMTCITILYEQQSSHLLCMFRDFKDCAFKEIRL